MTGSVKWFDGKKGFGFIEAAGIEREVFVHYSNIIADGFKTLSQGDRVEFELSETEKGSQAVKVKLADVD